MKEINGYRENGITDADLKFMRSAIGQRDASSYETPGQKANFLRRINHYNLDKNFVNEQNKIIATITKEEINGLARKYLQDENLYILVVGDGASNRSKLEKLGYEVVDVNAKGDIINDNTIDVKK